jgi:hypothetical protein
MNSGRELPYQSMQEGWQPSFLSTWRESSVPISVRFQVPVVHIEDAGRFVAQLARGCLCVLEEAIALPPSVVRAHALTCATRPYL